MSEAQFPRESDAEGRFVRQESAFRRWVEAEPTAAFPAEAGRYHLYVSYACPWAHRTIIFRKLKRLEGVIGMTVVDPIRDEQGWRMTGEGGEFPDALNGFVYLKEAYLKTERSFDARVTVPVLWDKKTGTIVNNESSELIRMLNSAFDAFGDAGVDFYPEALRGEIDAVNAFVYDNVNNGVYKCGFASSQQAYDEAFARLFDALERLEERLGRQRFLVGDTLTEADWRLFTTLVRFDAVYVGHFKCNKRRVADHPNLWGYLRDLYQVPGVAETVNMDHIKRHYYATHLKINPTGIVPQGPEIDFTEPHGRG